MSRELSKSIKIRRPDDFHVHLRQGDFLKSVMPYTSRMFARALVMPNTNPPILTAEDATRYRNEIRRLAPEFQPLMTIKILPTTTQDQIFAAKEAGVIAGKVYPAGMTTNSHDGYQGITELFRAFSAMEKCGMVLCLHGESRKVSTLQREEAFVDQELVEIISRFSRLRIVLEHITTRKAVEAVKEYAASGLKVAATITVHHLYLTLDDIVGGELRPHNFCKPVAKTKEDRHALRNAVKSGNPAFFLGTDSAPHPREHKENSHGSAGVFSAPVALPLLAQLLDEYQQLDYLEAFTSEHGARFYELPLNEGTIEIVQAPQRIPSNFAGAVPFMAGETIDWSMAT